MCNILVTISYNYKLMIVCSLFFLAFVLRFARAHVGFWGGLNPLDSLVFNTLTANLPTSLRPAKAGSSVGSREQTPDSSREKGLPQDHHHL